MPISSRRLVQTPDIPTPTHVKIKKLFRRGGKKTTRPDGWQSPDLIVVGLGNPGPKYRNTRHNVGWWCLDEIANRANTKIGRGNRHTDLAECYLRGIPMALAKPQTFMNRSGDAVDSLVRRYNARPHQIVVITDDMAIRPGRIRIRAQGGAGGHNGLKSIITQLGTDEFTRIRIGVGRPFDRGEEIDYVLSTLTPEDRDLVNDTVQRAADAVETIAIDGIDTAMNRFN